MAVLESLISGTAVSIVEQAIKAGRYAAKEIRGVYGEVEHVQRLKDASDTYVDNYRSRHCQIKIFPGLMKEPLELESIYTDVTILDDQSLQAFMGPEALEIAYRKKGRRGFGNSKVERLNGMTIANDKKCLMVLGGPGIGKSTFLRKIGLEAIKKNGSLKRECIPVFLELKKFREKTINIRQKIVEEFEICKFPAAAAFVDAALEQGKLLVLFDGLDEVPSKNLIHVIERIEDFVDQHSQKLPNGNTQNSFVASCRIAAYRTSFRSFTDVTIAEFNDSQIEQFIHRWFASEDDRALGTAEKYLKLLNQYEQRATKELAQTPLLLTFLCLVYDREQILPHERVTLYSNALNIILKEWSAQKRINPEPIYKGFHPALEQVLLAEIAYDSFQKDQLFFSKKTVTTQIAAFLTDMLDAPKQLDADAIVEAIEIQQGILVKRATDTYSFSHLTLQEYLTALHIVDNRLEDNLVSQHLVNDNWREVFLLVSGLMKNRIMTLLEAINQQACSYIKPYPKLRVLLECAEESKKGASELHQRAVVLAILNSVIGIDSDNDRALVTGIASTIAIYNDIDIDSNASSRAVASVRATSKGNIQIANVSDPDNDINIDIPIISDSARNRASAASIALAIIRSIGSDHHVLNTDVLKSISVKLSHQQRRAPYQSNSIQEWRRLTKQLNLVWLDALGFSEESMSLSPLETTAWKNYMLANELLLECKRSAILIPRTDWTNLERRLLTSA